MGKLRPGDKAIIIVLTALALVMTIFLAAWFLVAQLP